MRVILALVAVLCALASAEESKATTVPLKRKFCNVTGLPGDYRYEACGEFCKEKKAVNHCR